MSDPVQSCSAGSVGPRQDAAALDKDALEAAIKAYWGDPGYTTTGIVAAIQAYVSFGAPAQAEINPSSDGAACGDSSQASQHLNGDLQPASSEASAVSDRLANIMTWLREPDWTEQATLQWIKDWVNRRPIAELAMVAMLIPTSEPSPAKPSWQPINLTDEILDAALCEYWAIGQRGGWTESQRSGMRQAILSIPGLALTSTDREGK